MPLATADEDFGGADPYDIPNPDLTRPIRKLAAAILLQAVLDSKQPNLRYRHDARVFLYPVSRPGTEHLRRLAELAGYSPARLHRCLKRTENAPLPNVNMSFRRDTQ